MLIINQNNTDFKCLQKIQNFFQNILKNYIIGFIIYLYIIKSINKSRGVMKTNNSIKRIMSVLLAIALIALSFTSCGKRNKTADADAQADSSQVSSQSEETSQSSEDTSTAAETTTTAPSTTTSTTAATSAQGDQTQQTQKKWVRELTQFKGKKLIAITFDDGPADEESTGLLLDNLDKYNARVTFFVVGNRVAKYSSMLKREYEMGNQIGSHSYTHANLAKLSEDEIKDQIDKTNEAVKAVIGIEPNCMRPPYGSQNDTVKSTVKMPLITWSIDTLDWKNKNAETVCSNITEKAFDGAVVLLHDLYPTSVEGALNAMEILKEDGYAFVTIDELAQLRGVELKESKVYYNFKPEG